MGVGATAARKMRLAGFAVSTGAPAAGTGPLAITGIRTFPVKEPVSGRRYTVVKVETAAGIAGYGETDLVTAEDAARANALIRGRQATGYEALRAGLAGLPHLRAALGMALLDIVGKFAKAPVYQVLGGPTRFKARAMARLEGETDEAVAARCRAARQAGFRAFLVPVPEAKPLVAAARRRLETLRAQTGQETDFVLDAGARLAPRDAAVLSAAFERFHLLWLDEPCPVANLSAVKKLAEERVTPLGFGRAIERGAEFQDLLREDAIDILRPDIGRNGIAEIRRMAAIAETYYVAVAPHHEGGPIGTAAALQLAASLPNFFIQQIPFPAAEEDRRMRAEIAGTGLEAVTEGFAALPAGAGLGITVNEAALEMYRA